MPDLKTISRNPERGFLTLIPQTWVPYAELMRLDRPFGIFLFYFPYLFGLLFAANTAQPTIPPFQLLATSIHLLLTAVVLRGAACTWNDIQDREYDRLVPRTAMRPLPRGAVTPSQAYIFTAAQGLAGSCILATLPWNVAYNATVIMVLMGVYPFAKRVTYYPQVVLGIPIAWGVCLGAATLAMDPVTTWLVVGQREDSIVAGFNGGDGDDGGVGALACLYVANFLWTIIYDTVYAHLDVADDAKAGVMSLAVRYRDSAKALLATLAAGQTAALLAAGVLARFGVPYFVGAVGAGGSLTVMVWSVDLRVPGQCLWWFRNGVWCVGGCLAGGLLGQYLFCC